MAERRTGPITEEEWALVDWWFEREAERDPEFGRKMAEACAEIRRITAKYEKTEEP